MHPGTTSTDAGSRTRPTVRRRRHPGPAPEPPHPAPACGTDNTDGGPAPPPSDRGPRPRRGRGQCASRCRCCATSDPHLAPVPGQPPVGAAASTPGHHPDAAPPSTTGASSPIHRSRRRAWSRSAVTLTRTAGDGQRRRQHAAALGRIGRPRANRQFNPDPPPTTVTNHRDQEQDLRGVRDAGTTNGAQRGAHNLIRQQNLLTTNRTRLLTTGTSSRSHTPPPSSASHSLDCTS
jgi:hypothetical protein